MKKQAVIYGAMIVTSATVITRILGFVFRVFISGKLGAEGMGLYQLILSLYMLVVTFSTSGISIAVSRLVAEQIQTNKYGSKQAILKTSIIYSLIISLITSSLLFIFAKPLGGIVLNDSRTIMSLKFLAPSLPFMAVASCLKGYFFAMRDSIKSASAQVLEQVVKMLVIAAIIGMWLPKGYDFACAATVIGMTIGEVSSCLYTAIMYKRGAKKEEKPKNRRKLLKTILGISLPIQSSSTLNSLLRLIENLIILWGLKIFSGGDNSSAIGLYGILKGMVIPLLFFPTSIISAAVTTLIPEVAGARASGHNKTVANAVRKVLRFTILISVIIVCIFMLFPNQLGVLVYGEQQVGEMLKMISVICPFMYLEMVTVGLLNAMGEQTSPLKYNIIDSSIRISLIFIFVPMFGIQAFLWITIFSNLFTSVLNLRRLLKVTHVPLELTNWVIKPCFAAAASGFGIKMITDNFLSEHMPFAMVIIIGIILSVIGYVLILFLVDCLTSKDIAWIKSCFKINSIKRRKQS